MISKADFIGVRRTSVLRLLDSMISTDSESVYIDTKNGELSRFDNMIIALKTYAEKYETQ